MNRDASGLILLNQCTFQQRS